MSDCGKKGFFGGEEWFEWAVLILLVIIVMNMFKEEEPNHRRDRCDG